MKNQADLADSKHDEVQLKNAQLEAEHERLATQIRELQDQIRLLTSKVPLNGGGGKGVKSSSESGEEEKGEDVNTSEVRQRRVFLKVADFLRGVESG